MRRRKADAQGSRVENEVGSVHRTQTREAPRGGRRTGDFGELAGRGNRNKKKKTGPEPRGEIWETKPQMKAEREVDSW